MSDFQKILVVGASMGLSRQIADLLPIPEQPGEVTERDCAAIMTAEAKRTRRAMKRESRHV